MLRSSGNRTPYLLSLASCLALANATLPARAQEQAVEALGLPSSDDEAAVAVDEFREPGVQKVPHASKEHERRAASPFFNQVLKSWPLSVWASQPAENQCPLCGHTHPPEESPGLFSLALKAQGRTSSRLLGGSTGEAGKVSKQERHRLRPGETANILVQVRERLGSNALRGTSFDDQASGDDSEADESDFEPSPQTFVEWIQALDEEHVAAGTSQGPEGTCPAGSPLCAAAAQPSGEVLALDAEQAALRIEILRKSSRELSRTAELLEEADLFDQADEIHRIAGELRNQARAVVLARRGAMGMRRRGEGGKGGDEDGRAAAAF